jgi:hypothetical protein
MVQVGAEEKFTLVCARCTVPVGDWASASALFPPFGFVAIP